MTTGEHPTKLGTLITQLRTAAGLSMYHLAQRTGLNRSTLMRIEDGTYQQPTVETLNKLAQALDAEPEDLYDAVWKDSEEPLPSLGVYFRSKYHLSEQQIAELQSTVERITDEGKDAP